MRPRRRRRWNLARRPRSRARDRARGGQKLALVGEDLLQPPAGDFGEGEQPEGLAGRRAVHDHGVPLAALLMALELEQREQLVEARRDRQLVVNVGREEFVQLVIARRVPAPADGERDTMVKQLRSALLVPVEECGVPPLPVN